MQGRKHCGTQLIRVLCIAGCIATLHASTLQQLTLNDMILKSTAIVRGQVQPTTASFRGSIIYTHYLIQVSEVLKGSAATQIDVAVPGGTANGTMQAFSGAPSLVAGQNYVFFLWTSKSGLTQIIGLSQGLFAVIANSSGQPTLVRAAATERVVNSSGQVVPQSDIQISLSALRTQIQSVLGSGSGK